MPIGSPLDLPVPRNATALLQHLQRLVGIEHYEWWCGGVIEVRKLEAFCQKLGDRYPICRSTRERSYDRSRGRASVCLVVYPEASFACSRPRTRPVRERAPGQGRDPDQAQCAGSHAVAWWLVSTAGLGGLADDASPDAHVAQQAMSHGGHLTAGEYVLLYASKLEPREITDQRTGRARMVSKSLSTWTWQIRHDVMSQVRVAIDDCAGQLKYGGESPQWGLRGVLAAQRCRPLFSGVRTQVIGLHRYADDRWAVHRDAWLRQHPDLAAGFGTAAGALRSVGDVVAYHLPKKRMIKVYAEPCLRVGDLLRVERRFEPAQPCAEEPVA